MKWVVTGGCGFIGRALISHLRQSSGAHIRVLDNLSVGTEADLATVASFSDGMDDPTDWTSDLTLVVGEVTDAHKVAATLTGADVVVHLAANTGVPQSVDDPAADCHTNVLGTFNVLEACRINEVARMVFASSGAPLGAQNPPLHEELAPHPASPYGASKLAGEGYCSAYFHCFGVEAITLRFGNVYGEGSGHKQSVVAKFIKEALAGRTLEIYGDGSQTRDFIHISDLVNAISQAATVPGIGGETFQIATALETTVAELADELATALEAEGLRRPAIMNGSTRQGDVARNFSDTTKAQKRLDWSAEVSLADGLRRTVHSFLNTNTNTNTSGS